MLCHLVSTSFGTLAVSQIVMGVRQLRLDQLVKFEAEVVASEFLMMAKRTKISICEIMTNAGDESECNIEPW